MNRENKIRQEILKKVKEFYKIRKQGEKFIPGKTPVNYAGRTYDQQEMVNLLDSSLDFWLTAGRYAQRFEKKLAQLLGVKYCILANSGSSANLLAVSALSSPRLGERQMKTGDEVITIACGFPTTLASIIQNNFIPVILDVELGTYNIKIDNIKKAISKKTKAIFIAHTLGNPFDLSRIKNICLKHKLWLIEDNCDALGSKYQGKYTGTFGDIATCSFYPPHHITMGEGGAVLTSNTLLKRIILSFRDWGRDCWCETGHDNTCGKRFKQRFGKLPYGYDHKYVYSHIGYNLKVTDMQAAIGVAQLAKLGDFTKIRKRNFKFLLSLFKKYEPYFILPYPTKNSDPSWFGFPLLVKDNACFNRADIVNYLEGHKVATRMLFGGNLIKQPAFLNSKCRIVGNLKNTDLVMHNLFWLGVYPGITQDKLVYMADTVKGFFKEKGIEK